ncbi:MAG: phosphoglucosamine mutase [Candidatus Izimaplasma sp.]|nr:phosphoglucosamine mutase [Candidatus Izimaplasma bacterium]
MGKYFGTDGIRGEYGVELTNSLAFKVGQSLKSVLNTNRLVIGMDTRESSNELLYSLTSGAQSIGIDVMIAGVVSTPMISHYSKQKKITGVMITASHNPYIDNGIKVFNKGNKLNEYEEKAIEEYIDSNKKFEVKKIGKTYSGEDVFDLYADLIENIELTETNLRIGFDSANGANYLISLGVLRELCADFIQIGNKPDGKNINQGVGSTHLESIIKLVKDNNLDIGFTFDGDGDRILVVDRDLNIFDGDLLIYIIAVYLKQINRLKKNTVVLTSMSNLGIIKAFERKGIKVELTDVGDKYVLEKLNQEDYSIGGENSGHIILRDFINTGDGVLVAVYLLKVLNDTKKSLKELTSDIVMWPQKLVNIKTTNKEILNDKRVMKVIQDVKNILGNNGKVLVRPSGTEPLVRVTVSCETESELDKYMELIISIINTVKEED